MVYSAQGQHGHISGSKSTVVSLALPQPLVFSALSDSATTLVCSNRFV